MPAKEAGKKPREESSGSFAQTLAGKEHPKAESAAPKAAREEKHRDKPEKNESDDPPRAATPQTAREAPGRLKRAMTAREQAITKFMDSFESEFEIPPTEMVEAMAHLESKDLSKTPEETAEKVVQKLGLSDEDQEKAQAMYASLLMNLRQIDQAKATSVTGTQERFAISQEQRAKMNDALDQLTQKFWQTKVAAGESPKATSLGASLGEAKNLAALTRGQDLSRLAIDEESFDTDLDVEDADLADALGGLPGGELDELSEDAELFEGAGESDEPMMNEKLGSKEQAVATKAPEHARHASAAAENAVREFEADDERPVSNNIRTNVKAKGDEATDATAGASGAKVANVDSETRGQGKASQDFLGHSGQSNAGKAGEKAVKQSSVAGGGTFKAAMSASAMPQPLKLEDVAAALKNNPLPGATALPTRVDPQDHEANVQQIISQAQVLIKKGGGEMKVQMTPEGLGQIELKVALKDGKVQLQMATENPEAKKLVESSIADLRSSLAAHKLSVEHVKVDVVAGARTDNQARNEMNMNQGQERQETRQFWNQFQENFGNRQAREGLWDMPDMKAYRQAVRPNPLQPIDVKSPGARPTEVGKGRGLNLVA